MGSGKPGIPGAWLLRRIATLVPWPRREQWLAEWEGELAWAWEVGGTWTRARLRVRAAAALTDALWMRHRHGRQFVFAQDLRQALRALWTRPGFTLSVVLTLGVAIGAATAVFSVVDAVLLRPLPYDDPDALVNVWRRLPSGMGVPDIAPDVLDGWRDSGLFADLEAWEDEDVVVTGAGEPLVERAVRMSAGMLELLGVRPMRGRAFSAAEVAAGERVALVNETFWRSNLGADDGVLGRRVILNDVPWTIVGVMPRTFRFPLGGQAFWLPLEPAARSLAAVGRLRDGIAFDAAVERAGDLAEVMNREQPRDGGWGVMLTALDSRRARNPDDRGPLLLMLAVLAVLLVGCANAANLLLVHGAARTRELTIRGALGATRGRLMRLLLTECAVLSLAAVGLGVALAFAGVAAFRAIAPSAYAIFGPGEFLLDVRVLSFAVALGVATGVLFGVGPALVTSGRRTPLTGVERSGTGTRGMRRMRAILAAGELATAMLLLVTASLLIRSFARQVGQDIGIDRSGVYVLDVETPAYRYPDTESRIAFRERLRDRIATIPGVLGVTTAEGIPPSAGFTFGLQLEPEGGEIPEGQDELLPINAVDDAFFDVLRIPIVAGRRFDARDGRDAVPAAIIDPGLATLLWPGTTPEAVIGRRFRLEEDADWLTVVGVAGDVVLMGVDDRMRRSCAGGPCRMDVYRPLRQQRRNWGHRVALRATATPGLAAAVREAVHDLDAGAPIRSFESMEQRVLDELDAPRFVLRLVTAFTLIALGLAALGVYAVLAYSVAQRTREFGVRVALGANTADVMRDVVRRAGLYALAGIMTGGVAALITGRLLASVLFEVSPTDPLSITFAALALAVVALLASVIPARRATRVSPLDALRTE